MRAMISLLTAAMFLVSATVTASATGFGGFGGGFGNNGGRDKDPLPQSFGWFEDDQGDSTDDPDFGADRFGFHDRDHDNGGFHDGDNFHGLICKKIVIIIPRWIPAAWGRGGFGGFGFGGHHGSFIIKKIVIICRPPFSP